VTGVRLEKIDAVEKFSDVQVLNAIKDLKRGKSSGSDGISSEHFIYCHETIHSLLAMLFNAMLSHNHLPSKLMETIIIPIVKDNKGIITDKDNYRPVALTCISSKILELILLHKYRDNLNTTDAQFGFKSCHSTDLCTFVLKETIDHFVSRGSPMYICFLDASKVFDRINHWILCQKLLQRGLPTCIVRFLCMWFRTQQFKIKWSNVYSSAFNVTNGVRQGGILSPVFFNLYIDDLSKSLNDSGVGCTINSCVINHLFYADDAVLLAPSPDALKQLLKICENYACETSI